ncbi:MAG TPA: hypothetical protein VKY74_02335 [Chloroflexia bacterium]|nr:hypothetical protein [Chloroflexia bacterium]
MARPKTDSVRTNLYLTAEAARLLEQLTTAKRRGAYLSGLIVKAARETGLAAPSQDLSLAVLQQQLQAASRVMQNLQERVAAALAGEPPAASDPDGGVA